MLTARFRFDLKGGHAPGFLRDVGWSAAGTVGGMAQFVDWDLAAATAGALSKSGPAVSYEEAMQVVTELRDLTD
jgi:hypothetical protein